MLYFLSLLYLIPWVWIIVIAFKEEQIGWGIAMILFIPASYIYGILYWRIVSLPFIMLLILTGLIFALPTEELAQFNE